MKININNVKTVPSGIKECSEFELCIFGQPNEEIAEWINSNKLKQNLSGLFTNIAISAEHKLDELFYPAQQFEYLDGFSPNLNKKLHLGHFSNLVLAKSFQSLHISNKTISMLGDTLEGEITKEQALNHFKAYCDQFKLTIDQEYFASETFL